MRLCHLILALVKTPLPVPRLAGPGLGGCQQAGLRAGPAGGRPQPHRPLVRLTRGSWQGVASPGGMGKNDVRARDIALALHCPARIKPGPCRPPWPVCLLARCLLHATGGRCRRAQSACLEGRTWIPLLHLHTAPGAGWRRLGPRRRRRRRRSPRRRERRVRPGRGCISCFSMPRHS